VQDHHGLPAARLEPQPGHLGEIDANRITPRAAGAAEDGRAKATDRDPGDLLPADGLTAAPGCVGR
jgi:hypothetical protein